MGGLRMLARRDRLAPTPQCGPDAQGAEQDAEQHDVPERVRKRDVGDLLDEGTRRVGQGPHVLLGSRGSR
jgi:hypothetical protein